MEPRKSLDVENINYVLQCLTDDVKTEADEASNCVLSPQVQDKDEKRLEHEDIKTIDMENSPYVRTMDIEKLKYVFLQLLEDFKSEDNEMWSSVLQPQVKDKNEAELEHELHFDPNRTFISI